MDAQAFGQAIDHGIKVFALTIFLVTATVVGCSTYLVTRWTTPTYEDVVAEEQRQEFLKTLTPEQRRLLGESW